MGKKDTERKEVLCVCNGVAQWYCVQKIYPIHFGNIIFRRNMAHIRSV